MMAEACLNSSLKPISRIIRNYEACKVRFTQFLRDSLDTLEREYPDRTTGGLCTQFLIPASVLAIAAKGEQETACIDVFFLHVYDDGQSFVDTCTVDRKLVNHSSGMTDKEWKVLTFICHKSTVNKDDKL